MGDFLAIVKEKNFIEVVSRSINQVTTSTSTRSTIVSSGDHYHGGRSKGGKPQPCECHRQLGERGEHGLAKPTSGKVIFLWFLDCESNMKSKHPLSSAFVSHHLISGKAWICPAGSQAQNLTVLSGSSND